MAKEKTVAEYRTEAVKPKRYTKKDAALANAAQVKKFEQSRGNKTSDWKEYEKAAKRMK